MKIAVLSDTHNLLRPEVLDRLRGCGAILHGGDISRQDILDRLEELAPVYAVRGNNDGEWAARLPLRAEFELAGLRFCVAHKKKDLPADLSACDIAVCGHTHRYDETWLPAAGGRRTLLLNPGSCGPRRFVQPVTMAMLTVGPDGWNVSRIDLPHAARESAPKPGTDIRGQIELVMRETRKGKSPAEIARHAGMDEALAEQIARLYVTHPGVTADGIMTKMGL
ncbi:MAG: metallophosphoesterase family protein [Clostridia bacterium]|nr:metallophosphoesterase family protein [Clostridia bacterium]